MNGLNRRSFLANSAAGLSGVAAAGAFAVAPLVAAGKAEASERVQIGFVGARGRAGTLLNLFGSMKEVDIVAIADIDSRHLAEGIDASEKVQNRRPRGVADFRRLLDDPKIDAIVVGTPDHWHAIPTIMACQAEKDVYVEKPDGHNIVEGQRMVAAQRRHKRIVQMGTQARSGTLFHSAMDYIRSGKLGTCLVAKAWEATKQSAIGRPPDSDPPAEVDYDFWLGSAPKRPFNIRRFHSGWHWFFDYGTGDLGNDGVHRLDYARWALSTAVESQGGQPLGMPTKVTATGGKWYFDDMQEWPDTLQVTYEYPGTPGRILTYEMRVWSPYHMYGEGEGAVVYGDRGYIVIGNRRWRAFDEKDKQVAQATGSIEGREHIENFLESIKTRKKTNADLETVGHPSSVLCHAGNIAWRVGRTLHLDPATETFVKDDEANALRTRPEYRKPWTLPEV